MINTNSKETICHFINNSKELLSINISKEHAWFSLEFMIHVCNCTDASTQSTQFYSIQVPALGSLRT